MRSAATARTAASCWRGYRRDTIRHRWRVIWRRPRQTDAAGGRRGRARGAGGVPARSTGNRAGRRYRQERGMNRSEVLPRQPTIDTEVTPRGTLELLSQREVQQLRSTADSRILELFRRCALAVLNTGNDTDDARCAVRRLSRLQHRDRATHARLEAQHQARAGERVRRRPYGRRHPRSICSRCCAISSTSAPRSRTTGRFDLNSSEGITDAVFHILKQARVLVPDVRAEHGRLLGWPFDLARRIRIHERGGLSPRLARARHLHRLRSRRDEGSDEGRGDRSRQAA